MTQEPSEKNEIDQKPRKLELEEEKIQKIIAHRKSQSSTSPGRPSNALLPYENKDHSGEQVLDKNDRAMRVTVHEKMLEMLAKTDEKHPPMPADVSYESSNELED